MLQNGVGCRTSSPKRGVVARTRSAPVLLMLAMADHMSASLVAPLCDFHIPRQVAR